MNLCISTISVLIPLIVALGTPQLISQSHIPYRLGAVLSPFFLQPGEEFITTNTSFGKKYSVLTVQDPYSLFSTTWARKCATRSQKVFSYFLPILVDPCPLYYTNYAFVEHENVSCLEARNLQVTLSQVLAGDMRLWVRDKNFYHS